MSSKKPEKKAKEIEMAIGLSLHIGLNRVDPNQYVGWDGALSGCVNDANAMKSIAGSANFHRMILLLNEQATGARVIQAISEAAQQLNNGDIFWISFSGHGGQVPDVNNDEPDAQDETWLLYDRMLIDDELFQLWNQFKPGVRVLFISDSCHSGTVARARFYNPTFKAVPATPVVNRQVPREIANAVYQRDRELYQTLQWVTGTKSRSTLEANIISLAACQDNELALDGANNGLFTANLLNVWNNGVFVGDHLSFFQAIKQRMPTTQVPNLIRFGGDGAAFEAQRPFQVQTAVSGVTPPSVGVPAIDAKACAARMGRGPVWSVNARPRRFFAVEVATQSDLFAFTTGGNRRNDSNFFGSWSNTPFPEARDAAVEYRLPDHVWNRLRTAPRLYYRLWATDSSIDWVNALTTTPDEQADTARSIDIVD
jgi:hypothetical protein